MSCPRFLTGRGLESGASGDVGSRIRFEASTNFSEWVSLGSFTNFDGMVRFVDTISTNLPYRFYRTASE